MIAPDNCVIRDDTLITDSRECFYRHSMYCELNEWPHSGKLKKSSWNPLLTAK